MEISLIEEDAKIEIIEGYKTLKYKVKNNGKNINKVPVYMHWLNLMKAEKGENGIITYCSKCFSFFYFESVQQKHSVITDNCSFSYFANFCEYCGELFNEFSICCLRKCFDMFSMVTYILFLEEFSYCIFFIPIISLMWLFFCFFKMIFSKRIKKTDDIHEHNEEFFDSKYGFPFFIIFILFTIIYSLVFSIPYIFTIYFFQLFVIIKISLQKADDKANHIRRY